MSGAPGDRVIVSSPSGAGKTTLIRRVLCDPDLSPLYFSVSHTTRPPRTGEVDGREYHFVDRAEFLALREADGFLESAEVHGNFYGTSRAEVEHRLAEGVDVLLDIDVQGARQVRSRIPDVVKIFVFPPGREVLESRLRARGTDAPEQVARRLAVAAREMAEFGEYDYAIINDRLERAADDLRAILLARRARSQRRRGELEAILKTFGP